MSKNYCPFLYGKFRKYFRIAAFTLTFGVAACAGSSDQSDEVVETETSDQMSEDTASNDEGSGLIIEQEPTDETGNDVPLVEDSVMTDSESSDIAVSEEPVSDDTEAVPDEILTASAEPEQESPESLDATLDSSVSSTDAEDSSVMNEAIAAEPVADTTDSGLTFEEPASYEPAPMESTASFGQSSGVLPPGVIASPGAAIFIKSKYEKSSTTASATWGESSGSHTYTVKPGDTVSGIARKLYGSFAKTQSLAALNGISAPYIIQPGDVLKYDPSGASHKSFAGTKAGTIKVKAGDTLSSLASQHLGNAGAWQVLYDLNKSKISNPDVIYAGMVLSFNGSAKASTAKAKKWVPKKKAAPVAAPVEEPAVVEAPVAEEPAVAETPAEEEMPVAETTEEEAPAAVEESSDEVINVDLPMEDEE